MIARVLTTALLTLFGLTCTGRGRAGRPVGGGTELTLGLGNGVTTKLDNCRAEPK